VLRRVSLVVVMLVSLPALATAGVPLAPAATDAGTTPDSDAIVDRTGAAGVAQSTAGVEQSTTSNAARDPVRSTMRRESGRARPSRPTRASSGRSNCI